MKSQGVTGGFGRVVLARVESNRAGSVVDGDDDIDAVLQGIADSQQAALSGLLGSVSSSGDRMLQVLEQIAAQQTR